MSLDPEVRAMAEISAALAGLEDDARVRVLRWADDKFGVRPVQSSAAVPASSEKSATEADGVEQHAFEHFHELYEVAHPESGLDRVLVAAYWFQVIQGEATLDGFSLNKELKHIGHASSNITRDLKNLMERSPALMMKVRKAGSTRQARNQYRLTRAGIQAVEEMVARKGA